MSDTLLTYKVHSTPDPIQVSPESGDASLADVRIVASNSTHRVIDCQSISFSFLKGSVAKDFFADDTGIATNAPDGWTIAQSGSFFTAKPDTPAAGKIGGEGVLFEFSGIQVNQQIGTTDLTITEVTKAHTGTKVIELGKFPAEFEVGDLSADPDIVEEGGSTTLSWSGAGGGTYELQYEGADGETVTITRPKDEPDQPLPVLSGSSTVDDLEMDPTIFYLIVTMEVPGQDKPLQVKRPFPVTVNMPDVKIKSFTAAGDLVSDNSYVVYSVDQAISALAKLNWDVIGARRLLLDDDIVEGTSAVKTVTAPTKYTLHAYGKGGEDFYEITVTPKVRAMQISLLSATTVRVAFDSTPGNYTVSLFVSEATGE